MTYLLIVIALQFNSGVMRIIKSAGGLSETIKASGLHPTGFVPTMGALHQGHLSLVRNAAAETPLAIVSIYVNPTQFNDKDDLKRYPRTIDADLSMLGTVLRENDIVFIPSDSEIYPEEDTRIFDFGNLDRVMEALHRPGHFNGVAQVVSRLFEIVQPDIAWFGQKDFQQLAVIRKLVRQLGFKVQINASPIIREPDGLAMSSRNMLLEPAIRERASVIFRTISAASRMVKDQGISRVKEFVRDSIEKTECFSLEYFEIADDTNLQPVSKRSDMKKGNRYYGCIAVMAGRIRLIDNIEIPLA